MAEINRVISRDLDGDEVWIMYWFTEEKDKGSAIQRFCDSSSAKCLSLILSGKEARQFNLALPLSTVHVDKRVPLKKRIISSCTHDAGRMDAPSIINDSLSQVISSVSVVDHI